MRHRRLVLLTSLVALLLALPAVAEDWTRFRGANGAGVSSSTGLPAEFGPETNAVWKAAVPFGRSSPIVTKDSVFLTATEDGAFVTLALDRATGATLWKSAVKPARAEEHHHDTDSATTTPVTDGTNVYAFFQEFGIVSYDAQGKQRWAHPMGPFRNFYSVAASPIVDGNLLYMLCDQAEGSFLVALDTKTGQEAWRRNRPGRLESYTTPIVYPGYGRLTRDEVAEAWLIQHFGWLDRDGDDAITESDWTEIGKEVTADHWGAHAIRLGGEKPEALWNYRANVPEIATPLIHDGVFYMVEKGILSSLDAKTGELIRRDRITDGSPKVYASPVVADGRIYLATLDGTLVVVSAAREWRKLFSVDLEDEVWATPAIADGALYVRTRGTLYRFGNRDAGGEGATDGSD